MFLLRSWPHSFQVGHAFLHQLRDVAANLRVHLRRGVRIRSECVQGSNGINHLVRDEGKRCDLPVQLGVCPVAPVIHGADGFTVLAVRVEQMLGKRPWDYLDRSGASE